MERGEGVGSNEGVISAQKKKRIDASLAAFEKRLKKKRRLKGGGELGGKNALLLQRGRGREGEESNGGLGQRRDELYTEDIYCKL